MKHYKAIPILLIASFLSQGCISTVYLKPTADSRNATDSSREVDGEILKNEGGILFVDDGDKVVEIPTDSVEDIDHAGATVATAGGVMTALGIGFIILASATADPQEDFGGSGAFGTALLGAGLVIVGVPVGIGGLIAYIQSSSAAHDQASMNDSLEELSITPSPYIAPSARGLGVSIGF